MVQAPDRPSSTRLLKLKQQHAKLQRQMARETTRLQAQERKIDTRRKILAGAIVLAHADLRDNFRDILADLLRQFIEPRDKHLFPDVFTPDEIAQAHSEARQRRAARQKARDQTAEDGHQRTDAT